MRILKTGNLLAALAVAAVSAALATGGIDAQKAAEATPPSPAAVKLAQANNKFGVDLLKGLHVEGENTFMSPASIAMALQMTAEGAKGETLAEMHKSMHVTGMDTKAANREMLDELAGRNGVKLKIANSFWTDPGRAVFLPEYVETVKKHYDSEARNVNFSDAGTLKVINDWISGKTEGLIRDMLDEIPAEAVAYLINAIYFKGEWTTPFDKDDTHDADFNLADGGKSKVKMMSRTARMHYGEADGLQIIKLPYGADEKSAMWVVLPPEGTSLDSVVTSMNADTLAEWRAKARQRQGTLKLPRFEVRFKKLLNEDLKALGIKTAFIDGDADFTGMGRPGMTTNVGPLYIGRVIHEAVAIVNEKGTEAAAATVVEMRSRTGSAQRPFDITCDRPFLFFITDEPTGAVLFQGTVYQPKDPK